MTEALEPSQSHPRYDLLLMNGKSVKPVIILHYYRDLYSYADRKIMHFYSKIHAPGSQNIDSFRGLRPLTPTRGFAPEPRWGLPQTPL